MSTIAITAHHLALINSLVARVAVSEAHKFKRDVAFAEIEAAINVPGHTTFIDVYDFGMERYMRLMFVSHDAHVLDTNLEIHVGKQPERGLMVEDKPDPDPDPGTPGAGVEVKFAQAA